MTPDEAMKDKWGYADMIADIRAERRFAYVRYSDGDWGCIFGRKGKILDEHDYGPDLAAALRAAIASEPDYHLGLMRSMLTPGRWWASEQTTAFVASRPDLAWCSSLILHDASMDGDLGAWFDALVQYRVTVVSHAGMRALRPWLGDFRHVVIPVADCWRRRAEIEPAIMAACRDPGVVLFACSMPAKVWIRKAWMDGGAATLIDIGSVLDPYIGRNSRSYMREGKARLADPLYTEA